MKNLLPVPLIVALLSMVVRAVDPLPPPPALPADAKLVTVDEAALLLQERAGISALDVRTVEEASELGRIPGSRHVDFFRGDLEKVVVEQLQLNSTKPCLVYCALGGRARRAAERLAKLGFKEIFVLKDGFNAWKKAGKPVEGKK